MNEIDALFQFYALDAVTDEERAQVEAHLAAHPEDAPRLQALVAAATLLPMMANPMVPSARVKTNLMARVQADPRTLGRVVDKVETAVSTTPSFFTTIRTAFARFQTRPLMPALAGMAMFVAIFAVVWSQTVSRQLDDVQQQIGELEIQLVHKTEATSTLSAEIGALQIEVALLEQVNEQMREELNRQNEVLAIYTAPDTATVVINDTGIHPGASGRLTVDVGSNTAVLTITNLPDHTDLVYQLWLIQGETLVSAAIFDVNESGQQTLIISTTDLARFDAVGISTEPPGGSNQPTGDIVLLGTLSS
jgi:hypothetical protein